jgi:hypothetical protein
MYRSAVLVPAALALALVLHPTAARAADDGSDLVGVWEGDADGYKQVWTIKNDKGAWSVSSVYLKKGKEGGSSVGKDIKLVGGSLVMTQKYDKMPRDVVWGDGATLTLKLDKDKLNLAWDLGGSSGVHVLKKLGGSPAPAPAPAASAGVVGTWQGDVDGFKEVWTIKDDNGSYSVSGVYYKDSQAVGGYTGRDVKLNGDLLTFVQKYDKKPDGVVWADEAFITVRPTRDGKITYEWRIRRSRGGRTLDAVK